MSEQDRLANLKLPEGAIVSAEVHVVGYLDPEGGAGDLKWACYANCEVPLSTSIGLLELAKQDLIERCLP